MHDRDSYEYAGSHAYNIGNLSQGAYSQMYNGNISGGVNNYFSAADDPREVAGKIQRWLDAPDHDFEHREARKKHEAGTGQWFLDHKAYRTWLTSEDQTLWIYGKAGCCKTVLCSTIIEDIRARSPDVPLAYFYFTFRQVETQQYQGLLLSLISQFLSFGSVTPALKCAYERGQRHPDFLLGSLDSLLRMSKVAYVIVDAVDECPGINDKDQRAQVMHGLKELLERNSHVKLLLSSRKEPDVTEYMQEWSTKREQLEVKPDAKDIAKYVKTELDRNRKFRSLALSTKQDIVEVLTNQADGM